VAIAQSTFSSASASADGASDDAERVRRVGLDDDEPEVGSVPVSARTPRM
jgi:hypothetical protein